MRIETLDNHRSWIPDLAVWQFEHWERLTGFDTLEKYVAALEGWSAGQEVPTVLVAFLGSVNLLRSEMAIRPHLTPWLAQLFILPQHRGTGVGAALVEAAIEHVRRCGFPALYLYTSGTPPRYYVRLGWREIERVEYLGRERTIMKFEFSRAWS